MEIISDKDPKQVEEEIQDKYFMQFNEFAEIQLQLSEDDGGEGICYRCGKKLDTLTYYEPDFYYITCQKCMNKRKRRLEMENVILNTKEFYYERILGDRYLQLFLVDPIYFKNTIPHNYSVFKKIVCSLKPPSRNDIWFLDWVPGFPRIISPENVDGIKIVNLTSKFPNIVSEKDKITFGDYEIFFPETSKYEKHYSRYNIFNNKSRKTKRFKVGDNCYRLNNTEDPNVKSIFRIKKDGEDICAGDICYRDFLIIKLLIMRNKTFLKLIFDIILESMKYVKTVRDTVFLKNSVTVDDSKEETLSILWNPVSEYKNNSSINLSIL